MNRPGRNRTCNPRFWSALPATPALQHWLIFKDLALGQQRWRRWTTPALALILTLRRRVRQSNPISENARNETERSLPCAIFTIVDPLSRRRCPSRCQRCRKYGSASDQRIGYWRRLAGAGWLTAHSM